MAADSFGSAYITGRAFSFDFPTTVGAFSTVHQSRAMTDAFVARIRDSGPAGQLFLNRNTLKFRVPYQSTDRLTKKITLQNKGKGVVNYDITTDQGWLAVWPLSGDVRNEEDTLHVSVNPANLKPGTHKGVVKVSSIDAFNSPHQAVVTMKIVGPTIKLKRKKFEVNAVEGSTTTVIRESAIRNKGPGTLSYRFTPKEPWLRVTPRRGTSTGEWDPYTIKIKPSGLEPGIHQGIIEVTSKDTIDSLNITITLNIKAVDASGRIAGLKQ